MKLLREGRSFSGRERNCAFMNCDGQAFANISAVSGLNYDDDGRALAVSDWDQDGDLDLWFLNRTGPRLRLMINQSDQRSSQSNNFVAFQLQGTESNRDGIGARVTVHLPGPTNGETPSTTLPIHQTLSAGDAFLSQSSKWLHFGLGEADSIESVLVRWPSGKRETFKGCQLGNRYRLVEGVSKPILVDQSSRNIVLKPSKQQTASPAKLQRVAFATPVPLPIVKYTADDGTETPLTAPNDRPLVVSLWASWCLPCLAELEQLTDQADSLKQAGIDVLALSLNGLDKNHSDSAEDASHFLDKISFPWPRGIAQQASLEKILLLEELLFNRRFQLSIPTSLLITKDGELAAIYRGPISPSEIIQDVRQLNSPANDPRDFAAPLPGSWNTPPRQLMASALAREFRTRGYQADYARYLTLDRERLERARNLATSPEQRAQIDSQYAQANFTLGVAFAESGQTEEAIDHFRRAIAAQANHTDALINLGVLLAKAGKSQAAIESFQQAVKSNPDSLPARINLATALSSRKLFQESIEHYRYVLKKQPSQELHKRFGRVLLETGSYQEAAKQFTSALKLEKRDFASTLALAWLLATCNENSVRNGARAVELAKRLNSGQTTNDPLVLDILAAAFAEAGDFTQARETQIEAIKRLGSQNANALTAFEQRLRHYEDGRPFRDSDAKYP